MNKENIKVSASAEHDDFIAGSRLFRNMGWIFSFILLIGIVAQSLIYALLPKEIMASENGEVVGRVVFGEVSLRTEDQILADIKKLMTKCQTTSKITTMEDLSLCYNHMSQDLAEETLTLHTDPTLHKGTLPNADPDDGASYIDVLRQLGCVDDDYDFVVNDTGVVHRDPVAQVVTAHVKGTQICLDGNEVYQNEYYVKVVARIVPYLKEVLPYGLSLIEYYDIDDEGYAL